MIEVKNLTKIYEDKNKQSFKALDNVSFTLPNTGMVFILGKSGSGKSTLLNMLGGLDKITSGEIVADGNAFSNFKQEDYDNYRNTYIGFVFQDFCLIDNLTVYQNIELALQIKRENNPNLIFKTLENVGLKGFEKRYPKELSGGQKQRVAIARALVKRPKLILADEPTGNLDSKTSTQILKIFKRVSKENLVVIVSHNREDAENYADKIIEIEDGKIIRNVIRNKDYNNNFVINDNVICLPDRKLTVDELSKLNEKIKENPVTITSTVDKFVEQPQTQLDSRKVTFDNKNMSTASLIKMSYNFLRHRKISLFFTIIFVLLIITLLSVCQMFMVFDDSQVINEALANRDSDVFVMKKGYGADDKDYIRSNKNSFINDNEIQSFISNGYNGKIFKLYNTPLPIAAHNSNADGYYYMSDENRYSDIFAYEAVGVLQCDLDYLTKIFGNGASLNVISGDITPSYTTNQLIITDYIADSLIYFNLDNKYLPTNPNDIYGNVINKIIANHYYVCAVIDTGYKEKYASLIEKFTQYSTSNDNKQLQTLIRSEDFVNFIENLDTYYNVAYTLNPNYAEYAKNVAGTNVKSARNWLAFNGSIKYKDKNDVSKTTDKMYYTMYIDTAYQSTPFNKGEVLMPIRAYNSYFGTNYSQEDVGYNKGVTQQTIQLLHYNQDYDNVNAVPAFTKEVTVVGVVMEEHWIINGEDFREMFEANLFPTALYFDNTENISNIYNTGLQMNFVVTTSYFNAIMDLTNIVGIFTDYFGVIGAILAFIALLLLINFGYTSVKANIFEIGVIKALGGKNKNLSISFVLQMLFIGLIICILTTILSIVFVQVTNTVLVNSFVKFYNNEILKNLVILYFMPNILIIDLCATIAISLISSLLPIYKLRKVKPFNIIKQKNTL